MTTVPELSDDQLRAVLDGMASAVIVVDVQRRYLDANPAATVLLGYTRDEIRALPFGGLAAIPPPPPEQRRARLEQGPQRAEWLLRRKDGTTVPVEASMSLVNLPGGPVFVGVLTDISERHAMEEALRESEARLHSIVETSPDLISILDAEGCYRFVNSAYERVLGQTPDQLIGHRTDEFIHPEDAPLVAERFQALLAAAPGSPAQQAGDRDIVFRRRHADGRWLDMEAKWRVLTSASGEFTGVLMFARDVTERRRAEAARRESEQRFSSVVNNALDMLVIADAEGVISYVSPAVERTLAYPPEEMVGHNGREFIDAADRERVAATLARLQQPGAQDAQEFRVRHHDGSERYIYAVFTNLTHVPGVRGLVVNGHDVTERVELEQQLAHQAFHDTLTGLPNRALLMDRLEHALARARRQGALLGVLLLDLDRFKVVNDSLGHQAGDELLVQVGQRIAGLADPSDTVARLGGDEFTVLVEDVARPAVATALAERLLRALRKPFEVAGRAVHTSASIGVVLAGAGHETAADLLREADIALYEAKAAGKDRAVRYAAHMDAAGRLDMEGSLRRAIAEGSLAACYQPIVALRSGTVAAVEALARWQHPELGAIEPTAFIPIAEEAGLIVELWQWLMGEAGRRAREWQALRPDGPPLLLAVNISASHFQQPDLAAQVARALAGSGLAPRLLRLEITEHALMRDVESTMTTLRALKDLGVQIAIDDFGTGYSSLSYLRRFPASVLKVDRSFTQELATDAGTAAIVGAVCSLARALEMTVVVEGVENAEQLAVARRLGAHGAQGYFFAEPLAPEQVPAVLARDHFAPLLGDEASHGEEPAP